MSVRIYSFAFEMDTSPTVQAFIASANTQVDFATDPIEYIASAMIQVEFGLVAPFNPAIAGSAGSEMQAEQMLKAPGHQGSPLQLQGGGLQHFTPRQG